MHINLFSVEIIKYIVAESKTMRDKNVSEKISFNYNWCFTFFNGTN